MKALVKSKAEEGIWLQDMPEPECGNNDVIVKIHKTAICGTDIHIYNWDEWAQKTIPVPMRTFCIMRLSQQICSILQSLTGTHLKTVVPRSFSSPPSSSTAYDETCPKAAPA